MSARWPLPHRTTRLSLLLLLGIRPLVFIVALEHLHLDELRPRLINKVLGDGVKCGHVSVNKVYHTLRRDRRRSHL